MPDNNATFTLDDFISDPSTDVAGGDPSDRSDDSSTTVTDPVMQDIDSMFGDPGDDSSSKTKVKPDSSPSKGVTYKDGDPFGGPGSPRNLDASLQKLQSERDKYKSQIDQMNKDLQQYKSVADFTNSLWDDVEARHAFIATLEPDLVKPKDPLTFVKEELKKEFGEEFSPNADSVDPIQAQLYNARMQELYGEWKNKRSGLPKDLNDLRARRSAAKQKALKEAQAEKDKIMQDFKWDDSAWDEFSKWGSGFRLYHLAKVYNRAKGNMGRTAPQLALGRGGQPLTQGKYKAQLDEMFGPDLM